MQFVTRMSVLLLAVLVIASPLAAAADKPEAPAAIKLKSLAIGYHDAAADASLTLRTSDARQQLLATGTLDDGSPRDVTQHVAWSVEPAGIVEVRKGGLVVPLA